MAAVSVARAGKEEGTREEGEGVEGEREEW
jgi:hypothetical protein